MLPITWYATSLKSNTIRKFKSTRLSHRIVSINLHNVNYIKKIYYLLYSSHFLIIIAVSAAWNVISHLNLIFLLWIHTYMYIYVLIYYVYVFYFSWTTSCTLCVLNAGPLPKFHFESIILFRLSIWCLCNYSECFKAKKKDSDATHWNQTSRRHAICIQYMRATLLQTTSVPLIESLSKREPNWLPNNLDLKLQLTRYSLSYWLSRWEKML